MLAISHIPTMYLFYTSEIRSQFHFFGGVFHVIHTFTLHIRTKKKTENSEKRFIEYGRSHFAQALCLCVYVLFATFSNLAHTQAHTLEQFRSKDEHKTNVEIL